MITETGSRNPLRYFLLLWIGLIALGQLIRGGSHYTGGAAFYLLYAPSITNDTLHVTSHPDQSIAVSGTAPLQSGVIWEPAFPLFAIILFLLLIAVYCFLLWWGLSRRITTGNALLYFLAQGLLIFAIHLTIRQPNLTLSLCLSLTLCALAVLKQLIPVLLTATCCLLLFLFSTITTLPSPALGDQWTIFWITIWNFSDSATLILFVMGYLILHAQQKHSQQQLEQTHIALQKAYIDLAASSKQIKNLTLLTERQRMARELHDTLAQGLAGMIMQLEVTYTHLIRNHYPQAQQILKQTLNSARATLVEARYAITDLRSRTPDLDRLLEELHTEIEHFVQTTGIRCQAQLDELPSVLPQHYETITRFIREGLSNVARHAQASQVDIEIQNQQQWSIITIKDNGRGFNPRDPRPGHYGLPGLRERAQLAGGTFSITSFTNQGTTLCFRLPHVVSPENATHTSIATGIPYYASYA